MLALSLTLPTLAAKAQETAKKAHVGVLLLTPRAGARGTYIEALRAGLRELGYVEGRNLLLEIRSAEGRPDRLPGLAAEILSTRPDVLVPAGSESLLTLHPATDLLPITTPPVVHPLA